MSVARRSVFAYIHYACRQLLWSKKPKNKTRKKKPKTSVFQCVAHRLENNKGGGVEETTRRRRPPQRNECNILLAVLVSVKFRIWTNFACFIGEVAAVPATAGMDMGISLTHSPSLFLSLSLAQHRSGCVCVRGRCESGQASWEIGAKIEFCLSWHELRQMMMTMKMRWATW